MENTLYFGDNLSVLKGHDGQGQPNFPDTYVDPLCVLRRAAREGASRRLPRPNGTDGTDARLGHRGGHLHAGAGHLEGYGHQEPHPQILTIADLFAGKAVDLPQGHDIATLKRVQCAASREYAQPALIGGTEPEQ